MFYNYKQYDFLNKIKEHTEAISKEYSDALENLEQLKYFFKDGEMPIVYSHFDYWIKESGFDPSQIGYDARGEKPVGGFPLFKENFPIKWMDVNQHFKHTMKMLSVVPNLHFAQFSIMSPGSLILPHAHSVSGYIFHLNLFDLTGKGIFKAGNETFEYSKKGECFLFNPTDIHSSDNVSSSFRVTLMFDFKI